MIAFVTRRCAYAFSSRSNRTLLLSLVRNPASLTRSLSLTPIHHNLPNMQQMMDELSKNPKAMALFQAIKKDPKIMQTVQDLIVTMTKKGYLDLKNPTKQPSLTMLADNEVRTKLFELVKLLAAAGVFNTKDGANPTSAISNILGLLMPSAKTDQSDEGKQSSSPKYQYTYDATAKDKGPQPVTTGWADKLKKIFK